MSKAWQYLIITLFLITSAVKISANETIRKPQQIKLNYITTNEGLPQNTIDYILKDSKGFMWFGTWNGLCRYDGYNFKTYKKSQANINLPSNFIQTLCEDTNGNLWVGTDKGLACFKFDLLQFISIPELNNNVGKYNITALAIDRDNNIWAATAKNGLWKIKSPDNGAVSGIRFQNKMLPNQNINHICLLNDNHLLVGMINGLAAINLKNEESSPLWNNLSANLGEQNIKTIFQDSKGNVWIGTIDNGLFYYKVNNSELIHFGADINVDTDLSHLSIYDIIEDKNGTIIVGTLAGLDYFNPANNTFSHLSEGKESGKFLNNPFVNSLFADELGNIWIGTEKGGVNYFNSFQKPFYAIKHDPANNSTISHNTINSVLVENDIIWIGTAGGGLNRVIKDKVTTYKLDPDRENSLNSNFITSIFRDEQKKLWIGTWGGGLNRLPDENQNVFEVLDNLPSDPTSLCDNYISCIEHLSDNSLLIGTNEGLDIFKPGENIFYHVHEKMDISNNLAVGCILTDKNNRIWVGTENGLYRFIRNDLIYFSQSFSRINFLKFLNHAGDSLSLAGDYVISLLESRDGTVWIGTYGNGICKFIDDGGRGKFVNYNEEQGLCNNVAYAIEEDGDGNLWISTDNGLSKFNPKTEKFQNFYSSDGLLSDQFYWSASCSDNKGNLYFGGIGGLNYFNPAQFETYPNMPQPVFTEFSIFSEPVSIGKEYHSEVILNKPISETKKIKLSYKDAVFSIEFSALDYFLPEKIKYAYKMEGVDQDWVEVPSTRRFANYTNLSGGEYLFQVKAANSDGVWSENSSKLVIIVKPPFWRTVWFKIFAILFVVLIISAYIRYRTQFLKEQKRKLEKQVRERTHTIEEQKGELEKQNKQIVKQRDEVIELNKKVNLVNQLRLRFFTNISHEFRTPLTLIIDPLEQLINKFKDDEDASNTLKIINRNAQRLLHLINQLLYFRRIETGKLNLNVSMGNLAQYLLGIFESFKDLAEHQEIDYHFSANKKVKETWFDAEKIENIFYNLLSNAFKNTPVSGSISMNVEFIDSEKKDSIPSPFVSISVNDSGSGIAKEHLPHIFDRFYKAKQTNKSRDFSSSGIGLALTYEIVKALHGVITVKSEIGKGSSFTVCIPFTKDRYKSHEINQAALPTDINTEGRVNVLSEHIIARKSGYDKEYEPLHDKSKPTILIVEDNFDLRSFLIHSLRSDYRALGAENGKIGLAMAKKYSPELIISDIMMPEMDGIELCSRLKKNIQTSHIPVILLTAKNIIESWIEGLETGADDYIPKPFNLQILQVKVRNLIESRRKVKQMFSNIETVSTEQLAPNTLDKDFIKNAFDIIDKNYSDPQFSVEQFAGEMCMSQSLLYKKTKALTNLSITDFINSYKLKRAVELIKMERLPISDIAFKVGFNDPKYFSRIFKKFYGMSPSDFLNQKQVH